MNKLEPEHLYEEPMEVRAEGQAVVVLGPDSVAIAMTPACAEQSASRLCEAAKAARQSTDDEEHPARRGG